jgi:hypothetical protein
MLLHCNSLSSSLSPSYEKSNNAHVDGCHRYSRTALYQLLRASMTWYYVKWLITVTGKLVWADCYTHVSGFSSSSCAHMPGWWSEQPVDLIHSNQTLFLMAAVICSFTELKWTTSGIVTLLELQKYQQLYPFLRSIGERLFCITYITYFILTRLCKFTELILIHFIDTLYILWF